MTKGRKPARLRYDEGCLAAHALNVIGDRWALLVVRELMFAAKRFQAIRAGLPGITASVLTQRLAQLAEAGVVVQNPALGFYELTGAGRALLPVLQALCQWGVVQPGHDPGRFISPSALMISMTAMIGRGAAARGLRVAAGFDMGRERFVQHLSAAGRHRVRAVDAPMGDFILSGDGNSLAPVVYGPAPLADHLASGTVGLRGDPRAAQAFLDLFFLAGPPHRAAGAPSEP